MSLLNLYGFNSHLNQLYNPFQEKGLKVGRVFSIQGYKYLLITEEGELESEVSGALLNSKESWELPKVGDWVVFFRTEDYGYIIDVLDRQNELARKVAGKTSEKQVLVANIDYACFVMALDQDFNLMKLQRYLHQIYESNIEPIVILNKSDLVEDPSGYVSKVMELGYNAQVILTSTVTGEGVGEFKFSVMQPQKTYVLLGSSGVGKSSLLNSLLEDNFAQINTISESNKKGKHTTTFRYLTRLSNGSILIDTPGMREFGLLAEAAEDNKFVHPKIEELSAQCRFPDCQHEHEPGCAVVEAVKTGVLPELVYRSHLKLLKEQQRLSMSIEEKRKNDRQFGKMVKDAMRHRRKWKL